MEVQKFIGNKTKIRVTGVENKSNAIVKNLPTMQDTWVQFLGQENPLEKEMATHSSILFVCLF